MRIANQHNGSAFGLRHFHVELRKSIWRVEGSLSD